MPLNDLSISCNGSIIPSTNLTADIVSFDRMYQLPSPEQVRSGLDMNNFKPWSKGKADLKAHEYASVTVDGLSENSTYAVFAVLSTTKDGLDIYSLKEETVQLVIKTLSKICLMQIRASPRSLASKLSLSSHPLFCY
jgi:hypothetical protein